MDEKEQSRGDLYKIINELKEKLEAAEHKIIDQQESHIDLTSTHAKATSLLGRALGEIKHLRLDNQMKATRLKMFDDMMLLIHTIPPSQGYGMVADDIATEIEKYIR